MKKIITLFLILLLGTIIFCSIWIGLGVYKSNELKDEDLNNLPTETKKVILFIGDGMGENHIKTAEMQLGKKMVFTSFEKQGYVTTNSLNPLVPTDSAAAATALATGHKTFNGAVATYLGNNLTSISELAKENGLGVGIVTTDTLSGATPAGFSGHALNRGDEDNIIKSQLTNKFDLYLGAGYSSYIKYKEDFINAGYDFVDNYNNLKSTDKKVIGTFDNINNYTPSDKNPTLPILTEYAVKYMEQNFPGGYFLMIEGAHIDKMSHSNDVFKMINYLDEFNNSINTAKTVLSNNDDVCFIVTADHETGGLILPINKEEISNDLYKKDGHTSQNVKYYIHTENNIDLSTINKTIDNTDIFKLCRRFLNI